MTAPALTGCEESYFAILADVGIDTGRAIRTIALNEGPNTAWLRANSAVTRKASREMIAEREASNG